MNYYIDTDLRTNDIFIAPLIPPKAGHFIIRFKKRYEADTFLKKLVSKQIKDPHDEPRAYKLLEIVENEKGKVSIFEPL